MAKKMAEIKPKNYTAKLYQSSSGVPTAIVANNTIGTVTFEYFQTGWYKVKSNGLFNPDKTFVFAGLDFIANDYDVDFNYAIENPDTILLFTTKKSDGTRRDGVLYNTSFRIEIYP